MAVKTPIRKVNGHSNRASATMILAEEKLASSGLTLVDADLLHIDILEAGQLPDVYGKPKDQRPTLLFNYIHPITGQPLTHQPKFPPASRARFLGGAAGFGGQVEKQLRYIGPPNLPPAAYYPTNIDWLKVVNDINIKLIITEGELKAAKACKEGFPTIGLGGVWSFRSTRFGCGMVPSLELVNWARREVVILFDSDLRTNDNVCAAVNALTKLLTGEGAVVKVGFIPADGDDKIGLDDLLVRPGGKQQLINILDGSQHLGYSRPLWALNDRYVFVNRGGYVLNRQGPGIDAIQPTPFVNAIEATLSCVMQELDDEGRIKQKAVSAAKEWIHWPLRAAVSSLTYLPGEPRIIETEGDPYGRWNLWGGWGCSPVKGDVKPFLDLVDFLFTGATEAEKLWFIRWCAYPIQHPGTKLASAVVLHGEEGIGKGLLAHGLSLVYGQNFLKIGQDELESPFNSWLAHRQFIFGDEATGSEHRKYAAKLKGLITSETAMINEKYDKKFELVVCANFLFASNDADAFTMDDKDRRYFVHEGPAQPREHAFYAKISNWLKKDPLAGPNLFYYLLHQVDLGSFEPFDRPPVTQAKRAMIEATAPDILTWCRQLITEPELALLPGTPTCDLITSTQAVAHFEYHHNPAKPTSKNYMTKMLRKAGAVQACKNMIIVDPSGRRSRYLAIRNQELWRNASQDRAQRYLKTVK